MQNRRRRASAEWLLAVPVLTGAAGGVAPTVADVLLLTTALVTAALLWTRGTRLDPGAPRRGVLRGWRLLAVAVVVGLASAGVVALVDRQSTRSPSDTVGQLVSLPAVLLALVALLTLFTRRQLRAGGARLLTETALFFSASVVLAQVLVVGPALAGQPLTAHARLVLELICLLTAGVLSAVLVLIAVSAGARRVSGALLLLAATAWAGARELAVAGDDLRLPALPGWVVAAQLAGLVLLCLAALRDPGVDAVAPPTRTTARLSLAGQLLPHLVMVVAVLVFLSVPLAGGRPTPAAGGALLCCLALTAVHRAVAARDESRVGSRLRRSEAYFRSLVRSSSDAVLILDGDLRVSWAAPALLPPAGAPALPGRPLADVVHPDDAQAVRGWLAGGTPTGLRSFRLQDASGDWRVFEAGVSDLRADDDVQGLVLQCRDVTARLDRELELSSLAYTDPLTGLPNRAAQRGALDDLLAGLADPTAEDVALLLVEVHGLAAAGEHAGRDVVDVALAEIARRLRATVRAEDQVARIGAELFSVLAHGTGDEPDRVASRCLSVIDAPVTTDAGIVDLTAVVGLAPLTAGLTAEAVGDRAELAVRDARAAGAGSVRRYRAELTAARDRREQLRLDLVGARERGELGLVWQPVVALADHRVTGVEALLRWRHPLHGDVPPEEFLPLAERAGLLVDLQRWALHTATTAAASLPGHGLELKLGVNVSAEHLAAGTLVGDVASALRESGLSPERLVVEVAESALAGRDATDDVTALRLMGVRLALDDFGSGNSSLRGLGQLPVDIIKLDRALLSRVDRDPYTRAICEAVLSLGAALSVDVVAEGVETASQLGVLQALGCGYAQGFLLARPMSLSALEGLLEAHDGLLWPGIVGRVAR
ncbi:putative bifunctional diguanylate cyclase/phosphodiesterase [Modestobacter altitudinis]|uniref:putative bifunctional diguanylate cyclase/phosphodiesterase n=1 Tax=Modestobacter altitudinis TaxID=2213158 RepID=UPI00110C94A8|nr:GGDEF domain-containing phosphodiesterase [Modestobacter altitudinis]